MAKAIDRLAGSWAPYDESMPGPDIGAAARRSLHELRTRRAAGAAPLTGIRRVVVVTSSSRGGSTLVGALLRSAPGLLHLRAEINPLFAAARLAEGGDAGRRAALEAEIAADIGAPTASLEPDEVGLFAATVAWRLTAQWPDAGIDPDDVERWVRATLRDLAAASDAWAPPAFPDVQTFHLGLLRRVHRAHPEVNPWYYDLPARAVADAFPGVARPSGPPGSRFVEMPPFVLVGPWRRADSAARSSATLILTTPRNAFRLPVLESLFPAARFSVLHLTRNPAAAVNGLVDGWLHHGFFNCTVGSWLEQPGPWLRIPGYSDRFPAWGTSWWNFDFWPGWEDFVDQPLARVCAEQWRQHHEAVLAWIERRSPDWHRLRFEDVVGDDDERRAACAGLADWLGDDGVAGLAELRLPPLMATAPPRPRRWAERADELLPVLTTGPVGELAERLGYGDPSGWR